MQTVKIDKASSGDPKPSGKRPLITPLRIIVLVLFVGTCKWLRDFFVREEVPLKPSDPLVIRWPPGHNSLNVTRAMYITMRPNSPRTNSTMYMLKNHAGFRYPEVSVAIDGNNVDPETLPLYTRYIILNGRHDHSQVSTAGMVGCYMSHVKVLEQLKPGDVFAVFEEDALFTSRSIRELAALHGFVRDTLKTDFDLLYTGANDNPKPSAKRAKRHILSPTVTVSECLSGCSVWGTRGYVVTYRGAQKLLKHTTPVITQIDALFSLVANFEVDNGFKMFFLNNDIVVGPRWIDFIGATQVQDLCLKCYFPTGFWPYVFLIAFGVISS
eukprot:CAMPEP_0114108176 /NCGR_PEP_ID=MMETSP0043_2-20121206/81_1 /TAXON_ID=464988 /ORGANISM="Hemiselmis andersenii, Strain CCMP644" /LENGTH=325 /DNA_ID=CAMNT_0001199925 /DNA_START=1 /DNA_END=976 /DNA_ORIENTATION=+